MVHGMMLVSFSVPDENVFNADTSKEVLGNRASINFQTQEVPDFLHLRFGSPTGKSRKSHFFRAATGCPLFRKT